MITLYTFGPNFGLPDPSPFCMKAMVLLKMAGLPFETATADLRKAPKGKAPYMDDDGTMVPDSTFIRLHLEQKHGIEFDAGLSAELKGTAWALEKLCEDNLYWIAVKARWMDDDNFNAGPRAFFDAVPAFMRPLVIPMVRKQVARDLKGAGPGRHSDTENLELATRGFDSIAAILGDKPYLMGKKPCGADATIFSFAAGYMCPLFKTPLIDAAARHDNLNAYCERMMREYFPEFA